jgi:hypothetical protein
MAAVDRDNELGATGTPSQLGVTAKKARCQPICTDIRAYLSRSARHLEGSHSQHWIAVFIFSERVPLLSSYHLSCARSIAPGSVNKLGTELR